MASQLELSGQCEAPRETSSREGCRKAEEEGGIGQAEAGQAQGR